MVERDVANRREPVLCARQPVALVGGQHGDGAEAGAARRLQAPLRVLDGHHVRRASRPPGARPIPGAIRRRARRGRAPACCAASRRPRRSPGKRLRKPLRSRINSISWPRWRRRQSPRARAPRRARRTRPRPGTARGRRWPRGTVRASSSSSPSISASARLTPAVLQHVDERVTVAVAEVARVVLLGRQRDADAIEHRLEHMQVHRLAVGEHPVEVENHSCQWHTVPSHGAFGIRPSAFVSSSAFCVLRSAFRVRQASSVTSACAHPRGLAQPTGSPQAGWGSRTSRRSSSTAGRPR